jgi:hypothetical protein
VAYAEAQARRAIEPLRALEGTGRWGQLRDRLPELRRAYGGVPAFDEAAAGWEAMMRTREGSAILAADKLASDGFYGKALEAVRPASDTAAGRAIEARVKAAAGDCLETWTALEQAGRWHRLRKELEAQRERFRGVVTVDERSARIDEALATDAGRILVEADRLLADGAPGPALAACAALSSDPARALQAESTRAAETLLASLESLQRDGRWNALREDLAKIRPKLAGVAAFEERCRAWEAALSGPDGRAWVAADKLAGQGELGGAARSLAGHPQPELQKRIDAAVRDLLAPLAEFEAKRDWYAVDRALAALRKRLAGVAVFDERDAGLQIALRGEPARTALRLGTVLARLREAAARQPAPAGLAKEIEAFLQQAGDTPYAREARELLKRLPK